MKIKDIILEGIHDPGIFKAVFFIGGPGSGKSYVGDHLALSTMGLVNIDSDTLLTILMQKSGLDIKMPPEEQPQRDVVRAKAKELTVTKRNLVLDGRLGLQVQGTGYNFGKINKLKEELESLGYETALVVVNTDLRTAQERNAQRTRSVDPKIVSEKWQQVQANLQQFKAAFSHSYIINNSTQNLNLERELNQTHKELMLWARQVPKNAAAQEWIRSQGKKV